MIVPFLTSPGTDSSSGPTTIAGEQQISFGCLRFSFSSIGRLQNNLNEYARLLVLYANTSSRSSIGEWMPRRESPLQSEMVQGTLDLLILRTLVLGPAHGQTIAHAIERGSEEVLQVEHGSLYPALHRLENRGWIAAFWGTSEKNRKAKY